MPDVSRRYAFPSLERVRIRLRGVVRERFEAFVREVGWPPEDGIKILLAYSVVAARGKALAPDVIRSALGAARGELATLRHRAFMADDAIRTLKMNITGFDAALHQFEKSLPELEQEEARLRARLDACMAEAAHRGIKVEPDTPDPVPAHRSLLDFFRRHAGKPGGRT